MIVSLLTLALLLLGSALIIYIYDAYRKINQNYLLLLSVGFFVLVIGGALPGMHKTIGLSVDGDAVLIMSLLMQMIGIILIFYSVVK
ncbi:DUF7521 family protein [Archaeoglobus sulfaticallidus]|uniref:DUF7521 family protein n=1 Tax=Archaeoglobus sulfaticallidus TaxID=1316941 RepID=UPI000694A818|nr:hypothetical protein [Archaeoglobus sulfaticallidus]